MKDTIRIGSRVLPTDPFWVSVRENMRRRSQDLGVVLVDVNLPLETATGETQLSVLDDLFAQELDALISPRLPEVLAGLLVDAGLPLIYTDETEYTNPRIVSPRGLDAAAAAAARYLLKQIGERGTVVMIGGEERHLPSTKRRVEGFLQPVGACPQVRCIQVPTLWRYEEAYDLILEDGEHWRRYIGEPLAGIFGLSDSLALAGRDAFRLLGLADDRTQIVGINGDPLALAAIIGGTMHATVETSAWELACSVIDFGCRAARGEELPAHFPFALRLVTGANAAAVAAEKLVSIADVPSRLVDVNVRQEQQRLVQMQTSLELNRRVGSILDQDELLTEMAEIIRARYEYEDVQLFLWSQNDRCFVRVQEKRRGDEEPLAVPLAQSAALGHALLHNQLVYIPDVPNGKRFAPDGRWPDIQSRVLLPVHAGGRILGVLDLHSHRRTLRNRAELDALQSLADELGTAMRNAQLYAQAIQARAEAVQAGLLRSRLFAHVSHQLRTPLNLILGYCQSALAAARAGDDLPAQALADDLACIEHSGFDLQRLTDDLLDLAQAEAGMLHLHRQLCDARLLVEEIFAAATRLWANDPHVRWRLQAPAQLPLVMADPVRLRNVLMNLLDNAAKHTDHGQIILRAEGGEGGLYIWIEDTGCGMSAATLLRTRRNMMHGVGGANLRSIDAEHVGLGLAMAYHVLALHSGDLQIDSEEGRGTTCRLRLPPAPEAAAALAPVNEQAGYGPRSHLPDQAATQLAKKVQDYVAAHFAAALTREEIAAALGVSPSYISRVFQRCTGMTLWDYVNSLRVARARELLEHSDMTITEVAFAVGYNDPAYFSRMFRKLTGKAPRAFRLEG